MEALKILEGKPSLNWEYDEEADVLYISVGKPRSAVGVDIGEGVEVDSIAVSSSLSFVLLFSMAALTIAG